MFGLGWFCKKHEKHLMVNGCSHINKNHNKCNVCVATPLLEECEDDTHTPKTLKFDCKGQNTLPWGVPYIIGKLWKCRCRKWSCMSHLDICNASYGKKKGQESNWRFDSQPLKVGNQPDPGVCRWSATHRWKSLTNRNIFFLDLIPIGGLSKELWTRKIPRIQTGTISKLLLGSPGTKSHLDVGAVERRKEYYMGEGGGFPQVWAVVSLMSPRLPVACPSTKGAPKCDLTNLLVGLMQVRISN